MKKEILSLVVLLVLTSCHSITESNSKVDDFSDSSILTKAVDSISVFNDSVKVDSVKVVDSLKK
jgi:hypothetical protein